MITFQTIQIMLFLIPGFFSEGMLNILTNRDKKKKEFGIIVEALIFSMLIYTIYALITGNSLVSLNKESLEIAYNGKSFLIILSIAFILPVLISILHFNGHFLFIARKLKLTKKTPNRSVWDDVFKENDGYIIIDFANTRRMMGHPRFFSDDEKNPTLYLEDPAWIVEDEQHNIVIVPLDNVSGVYISSEQKIDMIEFCTRKEKP